MLYITLASVEGAVILLNSISVEPCVSATIRYTLTAPDGSVKELTHVVEGEQYARWGTDDTILYHLLCAKHKLHYKPYVEPEFFEEIMVSSNQETGEMKYETVRYPNPKYNPNAIEYKPVEFPTSSVVYESTDSRSVHNEADIQRIQTLQEQLDAQAAKLKTITDLLFKNGAI
jgi:hypothetical protein